MFHLVPELQYTFLTMARPIVSIFHNFQSWSTRVHLQTIKSHRHTAAKSVLIFSKKKEELYYHPYLLGFSLWTNSKFLCSKDPKIFIWKTNKIHLIQYLLSLSAVQRVGWANRNIAECHIHRKRRLTDVQLRTYNSLVTSGRTCCSTGNSPKTTLVLFMKFFPVPVRGFSTRHTLYICIYVHEC